MNNIISQRIYIHDFFFTPLSVGVMSQDCTFDNEQNPLCGWIPEVTNTDYNWKVWEGATPQKRTGPPGDHTSGGMLTMSTMIIKVFWFHLETSVVVTVISLK